MIADTLRALARRLERLAEYADLERLHRERQIAIEAKCRAEVQRDAADARSRRAEREAEVQRIARVKLEHRLREATEVSNRGDLP